MASAQARPHNAATHRLEKEVAPMKVAQVAPLYEAVPPRFYGGTERVVAYLSDALVELGHEVTLFATADARTRARLVPVRDQAIRLDDAPLKSDLAAHLSMLYEVRRRARQFDVLHFHVDMLHFPMFEQQSHKCVTTLHGRLDMEDLLSVYARWSNFGLVSISNAQRKPLPHASWLATVSHGVPARLYPFSPHGGGYLAFLGRISPEKRPDLAVRLAREAGVPLRIAAKVDPVDVAYFERVVHPLLEDPLVEYIGEIGDEHKAQFLGGARALLFPINWPEPFGLVMIEAMACGTPVIAWNCGSVREIVEDGVNGIIVNSEAEALRAIARVPTLDRQRVRATFERRFTSTVMARAYLEVYERLLESGALERPYAEHESDQ
jgi:glycosyltransferase involved in cell wall biosynthesis